MSFMDHSRDGLQNFFKYIIRPDYNEPEKPEDVLKLMKQGKKFNMPIFQLIRDVDYADPYLMDGYSYRSKRRHDIQQKRSVYKPVGPSDMYKFPVTNSMDIGWWISDPALKNENWYKLRTDYR